MERNIYFFTHGTIFIYIIEIIELFCVMFPFQVAMVHYSKCAV